jgi:hypothetical protein
VAWWLVPGEDEASFRAVTSPPAHQSPVHQHKRPGARVTPGLPAQVGGL